MPNPSSPVMALMRVARAATAAIGCAILLVAGGCSTGSDAAPTGPWAAEIVKAQRSATSDFERKVLADGVIGREEYEEAVQRYVACMQAAGYRTKAVDPLNSGVYQFETTQEIGEPEIDDETSDGCRRGTLELIGPLYEAIFTNPNREDFQTLVFACLQRGGFAPKEMTVTEFKQRYVDGKEKPPWAGGDQRAQLCHVNPGRG